MKHEKKIVVVPRSHVAAARAQIARDKARGRTPDPRMVALANAKTYTGPDSEDVARVVNATGQATVVSAVTGDATVVSAT
jgi:hypothetical protein